MKVYHAFYSNVAKGHWDFLPKWRTKDGRVVEPTRISEDPEPSRTLEDLRQEHDDYVYLGEVTKLMSVGRLRTKLSSKKDEP